MSECVSKYGSRLWSPFQETGTIFGRPVTEHPKKASSYRARLVINYFETEDTTRMEWSDLNHMRYVWEALGELIVAYRPSP
ncbi:hypothetical protein TNCV_2683031 [Trichonephila clavipes]|nr:hypothetical protein TNCV_2683031 [Trichonephila clavipes]